MDGAARRPHGEELVLHSVLHERVVGPKQRLERPDQLINCRNIPITLTENRIPIVGEIVLSKQTIIPAKR